MDQKVTNIQITPIKPRDGLVAFASFVFNNSFYFSSIAIYTRPLGGYRLAYPTRKSPTSSLHIFHPINKAIASAIEEIITGKYEEIISGQL
jgi:DNA-binding cell septation regulator SpoVG